MSEPPVVQLREALAARDELKMGSACHPYDAALADAAEAALEWMADSERRMIQMSDEIERLNMKVDGYGD